MQRAMIEALRQMRLDHLEIGREVEIARREKRMMADMENLSPASAILELGHIRQDRIADGLKGLCDQ